MKAEMKIFLLMLNILLITACQGSVSQNNKGTKMISSSCTLSDAENKILNLEEVKSLS